MESARLDDYHKTLLQLVFQNRYIANNIMMGDKKAEGIEIHDDGSVRLFSKHRTFKWLCYLFKDYKDVSFKEVVLMLIDIISGPANKRNQVVFDGMITEFTNKAVRQNDYNYVVEMLFFTLAAGIVDGEFASMYLNTRSQSSSTEMNCLGRFQEKKARVILNSGESLCDDEITIFTKK